MIYLNTTSNVTRVFINMKDLSFLRLHNSLGFKMNKGFNNLCTGDTSTSTLNQQKSPGFLTPLAGDTDNHHHPQPTLEEMIMRLDLEEKMATRAKLQEYGNVPHRMSCVNSSDILRSARNALNQYPRFSLDGKDAMYRSSFRNRTSVHRRTSLCLPTKVAGERVIWCNPGVVGKLMGLDAMPIPIRLKHRMNSCILRKQNLRRKCLETQEMARRKVDSNHHHHRVSSCSRAATATTGYCVTKPVVAVEMARGEAGWPMRRFL